MSIRRNSNLKQQRNKVKKDLSLGEPMYNTLGVKFSPNPSPNSKANLFQRLNWMIHFPQPNLDERDFAPHID